MEQKIEKLEELQKVVVQKLISFQARLEKINASTKPSNVNSPLQSNTLKNEKLEVVEHESNNDKSNFEDGNKKSFTEAPQKHQEAKKFENSFIESLYEGFKTFDKNGDGLISSQEIVQVMHERGYKISETEATDLIKEFDINSDGFIDYNEFIQMKSAYLTKLKDLKEKPDSVMNTSQMLEEHLLKTEAKKKENEVLNFWDILIVIGITFNNILALPFRLAFIKEEDTFFILLDLLLATVYCYDLFHPNFIQTSNKSSFRDINFYIDLMGSIPWYLLFRGQGGLDSYILLLQLCKVPRFWKALNGIEKHMISVNPTVLRLIHLSFLVFIFAHWSGCIWFLIGTYEGFGVNEWVPSSELGASPIYLQYLFSLYWGFVNISAINGQTHYTTLETIFGLTIIIMGISVSAAVIGNVGSLLGNLDALAGAHQRKLDSLANYMRMKQIPLHIQNRVYDYQEYLWSRQKGLSESSVFKDLPVSIKTDIALFLNRDILRKVPFLKTASDTFINVLVRSLTPEVYAPGEYIIRYGDVGREMYFIKKGQVVVCSEDGNQIYAVLHSGGFFGEYALLFDQKRTASVRSITYCDLFVLSQENFAKVLADFPEFENAIRREGIRRVLEKMQFFENISKDCITAMLDFLRPQVFSAGSLIVKKGEIGNEMYFICKGTVEVISEDGKQIFKVLKDGEFFGEIALLFSKPRTASVRASSHCDVLVLTRKDFNQVLKQFPSFQIQMKQIKATYSITN